MNDSVDKAVREITRHVQITTQTAIILGSGLGNLVAALSEATRIPYDTIPHFPVSGVPGHQGEMVLGSLSGIPILAMSGRVHYYEGHPMQTVTFPVRVLAGLGIRHLIVTNAAGGINTAFSPGDLVLLTDHINLMGDNPLRGSATFIDMTRAYDPDLGRLARQTAERLGLPLGEGVYLAVSGPLYETPAEIRMFRGLGADLVGMSTVPEVIMANSLGVKVLGMSMVTNMAAGITGQALSHQEVMETGRRGASNFEKLVTGIITGLGR
jgi:purine-nucleoside phosphorylase